MRSTRISLPDIAACLYDAAIEPAHWPEASLMLGTYTQSLCNMMWVDRTGKQRMVGFAEGFSDQLMNAFVISGLYRSDLAFRYSLRAPLDTPGIIEDFGPREEYERTEIYKALTQDGIVERCRSVVLRNARYIAWAGLARKKGEKAFDRATLRTLGEISPHVRRAIQVTSRLQVGENRRNALLDVMDRLEHGVFLVDDSLRVTYFNLMGRRLLRESDVLTIGQRMLNTTAPSESRALQRLLHGAVQAAKGNGSESGGSLALHDTDGRIRLYLDVAPLRAGTLTSDRPVSSPHAMVVARIPEARVAANPKALRELFSLSPGEAELAVDLAQGGRLNEIAQRRGVALATVRTQLAFVFEKTGVHRQSQVVKLVMGLSRGVGELPESAGPGKIRSPRELRAQL